ncbi:type II secretory system protein [Candidatus Scalindua japonica]|uniref:Type II secretory system protein n=1 Tax=Candidatus Scalindua japonica TaxID=1284222 RepID=A0A286U3J7_9BACT|nr:AAA family ATPase [Candidatus Scalindua japonica]GAX62695.1 type II secretory system protein [Candidatus Scalindua japonica]
MNDIAYLYKKFGFNEPPFNQTPDTRFLFKSSQHMAALNHLKYALLMDGFTLLTGTPGIGKTLLCRQILRDTDKDVQTVYIYNTYFSMLDLFKLIYHDITGEQLKSESHSECFNRINQLLLLLAAKGKKVVVIIDEAQGMTTETLEGLRLLSNLETEKKKLLSFILIGQPELESRLAEHNLRQLDQRISVRYVLKPFKLSETREYVGHRMHLSTSGVVNDKTYQFSAFAICLVHWFSRGVPRRINQICGRALLASFNTGKKKIGILTLLLAAREIIGRRNSIRYQHARHQLFVMTATILTIFGFAMYSGLGLYQDKLDKKKDALSFSFERHGPENDSNISENKSCKKKIVVSHKLKESNVFSNAYYVNQIISYHNRGQEFLKTY